MTGVVAGVVAGNGVTAGCGVTPNGMGARVMRAAWKWYGAWGMVVVALLSGGGPHATAAAQASPPVAAAESPRTAFLVVVGVGGEKRLADAFHGWAATIARAATARFGIPDSLVTVLGEDSTRAGVQGRSTRDNVLRHLARLVASSRPGDRLVIILFGHGATQEATARFNVPGPDLSAEDFRTALAPLRDVAVVFVNTTSASGDFVKALSAPNRTIIAATRSGREQNATLFPAHFVAALTQEGADSDKDGRVNLLEAFTYARREVARVFEQGNRLATEHAVLDDDGDGVGHGDASERGPDGPRARTTFLEPLGGAAAAGDPRVARLVAERREIEGRIEQLRARRTTMREDEYQKALEPLMVELAEKTRALRALEGRRP